MTRAVRRDRKVDELARHPLLASCDRDELDQVAAACDSFTLPSGTLLAREGRVGHWFFFIVSGRVDLLREGRHVGSMWGGGHVGELTLTDVATSPWTVRASGKVKVVAADRRTFAGLVATIPSLRRALVASVATRLREAHDELVFDVGAAETDAGAEAWPRPKRWRGLLWTAIALQLAIAASLLYHPPVVVLSPGFALDIASDISVTGPDTAPLNGRYLLVAVSRERPTLASLVFAPLRAHTDVSRIDRAEVPSGASHRAFLASREAAVEAASAATGGARFDVRLADHDFTGPSGGLAYALAVADVLSGDDLAAGRTVAATGSIAADGTIGRVGGVHQKAVAAVRAGADVLVVPLGQAEAASGFGMRVVEAGTLADAVRALR